MVHQWTTCSNGTGEISKIGHRESPRTLGLVPSAASRSAIRHNDSQVASASASHSSKAFKVRASSTVVDRSMSGSFLDGLRRTRHTGPKSGEPVRDLSRRQGSQLCSRSLPRGGNGGSGAVRWVRLAVGEDGFAYFAATIGNQAPTKGRRISPPEIASDARAMATKCSASLQLGGRSRRCGGPTRQRSRLRRVPI